MDVVQPDFSHEAVLAQVAKGIDSCPELFSAVENSAVTGSYVFTSQVNALTRIEAFVGWVSRLCSEKCSKVQILHGGRTKPDYETLKSFVKWAFSSQSYY